MTSRSFLFPFPGLSSWFESFWGEEDGNARERDEAENKFPIPLGGGEVTWAGSLLLGQTAGLSAAWSVLNDGEATFMLVPDELDPRLLPTCPSTTVGKSAADEFGESNGELGL
jgi:hypothetical protein